MTKDEFRAIEKRLDAGTYTLRDVRALLVEVRRSRAAEEEDPRLLSEWLESLRAGDHVLIELSNWSRINGRVVDLDAFHILVETVPAEGLEILARRNVYHRCDGESLDVKHERLVQP